MLPRLGRRFMDKDVRPKAHKRGADRNELAVKRRKHTGRFNESRDIREDRSTRQFKFKGGKPCR